MHFLRYQEFYESSSSKFRGKAFTIFDFMKWYSKEFGDGAFTYTTDWAGFNIPGSVIADMLWQHGILDPNDYDKTMEEIWEECNKKSEDGRFYLIGVSDEGQVLEHEISHGYFYLYPEYKKEMTKLVKALPKEIKTKMKSTLKSMGYTKEVYVDEMQAYLATGLPDVFENEWVEERKPFVEYLAEFKKELVKKI